MPGPDPTVIMADQAVRVLVITGLQAAIYGAAIFVAFRAALRSVVREFE